MVSYPRKVALLAAGASVLASGVFGYLATRSTWSEPPAPIPVVAAEVVQPPAPAVKEPQRVQKQRKGQRHD